MVIVTTLGGGLWGLYAMWLIGTLQLRFIGKLIAAAFSNDSSRLSDWSGYSSSWGDWGNAFIAYWAVYGDLFDWLAHGSK